MNIRIFSPENIKADDYRHRYPELERESCFDGLSSRALIFIWWYSNQSSPLVIYESDDYVRVEEALKKSGFNPGKTEKERILKLQWDSQMAVAIKKMGEYDPGARLKAYMMIKRIYDQYELIIEQGPKAFTETTEKGEGEEKVVTTETDYKKYVDISAKIAEQLPLLLIKLEEGFAIVNILGEEVKEDESSALRDWQEKKSN